MGKARTNSRGKTMEQQLRLENQQLKKQVSSLRKQLARIDIDRYSTVKDMIEEAYESDRTMEKGAMKEALLNDLKQIWQCKTCQEGYLEVILYTKAASTWYFRKCNVCTHRTISKEYNSNVQGIIKNAKGKVCN